MNDNGSYPSLTERLAWAKSDYDLADYLEADLSSRIEATYMSGDLDLREHLHGMWRRTFGLKSRLHAQLQALRSEVAPTFEDILRDPISQMDTKGVVLASILEYQNATTGTACACGSCPSCLTPAKGG